MGCGHVSARYFDGLRRFDRVVDVRACADSVPELAAQAAAAHDVRACRPDELLRDPEIDVIVNLTPPLAHARVSTMAIAAGKHVYSEKPLATTLADAGRLLDRARRANLLVGCAPDTFLGGAHQTCRTLLDEGRIGEPVAAVAFVSEHGYEHFHPNVDSFYSPGGGPVLDLGPYYLTALVSFFGPARRVIGLTRKSFPERTILASGRRRGERIPVRVPTHATGAVEFASGPIATVLLSWDIWSTHLPYIELYGTSGSLAVPNPDEFSGLPRIRQAGEDELRQPPPPPGQLPWLDVPLAQDDDVDRGVGVAEMASALRCRRPHRASGELAYHVLETLIALENSSRTGRHVEIESRCERPAPFGRAFALSR